MSAPAARNTSSTVDESTTNDVEELELVEMSYGQDISAAQPLIQDHLSGHYSGVQQPEAALSISGRDATDHDEHRDAANPTAFIWKLVLAAGLSGLLFGYDTGVVSSTLVSINTDLSSRALTTLDKSLITSSTSLFAFIASPLTGLLADSLGRKRVILLASVLFIIGAIAQALCNTVTAMIAGRSVVGLAVGSASFVVPLYIGELSPSRFRGQLVTTVALFITAGQVVAYVVGYICSETAGGWRWMVGLGALPAAVQLLLLWAMPETPRWLIKANKENEAAVVLRQVYGDVAELELIVKRVLGRVREECLAEGAARTETSSMKNTHSSRWLSDGDSVLLELFQVGANRRALLIACLLQGAQQLCGFNSLMYFSATIFAMVGFTSPTLTSLTIATTNLLFTFVAFRIIDRVGRRRILLFSIPFMVSGLVLCAIAFAFLDLSPTSPINNVTATGTSPVWSLTLLLSLILYVAAYAIGLGNVPWQQSELFPLSVRALGSGLATATNWGSNTLVGLTFLPMMEILMPTWTFICYAVVCASSWVAVWYCYPETAGLGLEEVGGLLQDGWGVNESLAMWAERKSRDKSVNWKVYGAAAG